MSKPYIHAISSQKRFGGTIEDYMPIHELMDCSKGAMPDNRHRALTHNSWFIMEIVPKIFGETFTNSAGRVVSSRDIAEMHVLEDYSDRFIPSAGDFLNGMDWQDWMNNGKGDTVPASYTKIQQKENNKTKTTRFIEFARD